MVGVELFNPSGGVLTFPDNFWPVARIREDWWPACLDPEGPHPQHRFCFGDLSIDPVLLGHRWAGKQVVNMNDLMPQFGKDSFVMGMGWCSHGGFLVPLLIISNGLPCESPVLPLSQLKILQGIQHRYN
jgi:hypothetical protein